MLTHSTTKSIHAPNLARSAMAPLTRAGVITANIIWNAANDDPGTVGAKETGSAPGTSTPDGIPITSPTSRPNAIPFPATRPM